MPTRIVGTCCCGPPNFGRVLRFWVQVEETYGQYGALTSHTITPLGSIPASYQRTREYKSDFYGDSTYTDTIQTTSDYNRHSLFGVTYGNLSGGSLDANDWVTLFTDMTDANFIQCDINGTTIQPKPIDDSLGEQSYFKLTSDWTRTFTYGNATYRFTASAGTVFNHATPYNSMFRGNPYEVHTVWDNDDDYWISKTLYAMFSIISSPSAGLFERVQQQ